MPNNLPLDADQAKKKIKELNEALDKRRKKDMGMKHNIEVDFIPWPGNPSAQPEFAFQHKTNSTWPARIFSHKGRPISGKLFHWIISVETEFLFLMIPKTKKFY